MKFYGQWSPKVDEVLFRNFFKDQKSGTIIECGSYDGIIDSNTKHFEELGWTCVNIEPEPSIYKKLCINRQHKNNINLDYVLSNTDDKDIIFELGPVKGHTCAGKTKTYSSIVDSFSISKVDCFVLDVEGHELEVIDGMKTSSVLPDVICVEYTWSNIGLERLDERLIPLGYSRLFLSFNNAFYSLTKKEPPYFGTTDHWSQLKIK